MLPLSCSRFKYRFKSKKLGLVISSLSSLSQLSSRLSISSTSRFFCSSFRDATHFFFQSLCTAGFGVDSGIDDAGAMGIFGFGAPKNEVIEALVFVFLASVRGRVDALRFKDMVSVRKMKDRLIVEYHKQSYEYLLRRGRV